LYKHNPGVANIQIHMQPEHIIISCTYVKNLLNQYKKEECHFTSVSAQPIGGAVRIHTKSRWTGL